MDLPQEIEIWYVVPAIRKALVMQLKEKGLLQKDIAKMLGITESAISQYMKDKRAIMTYDAFKKTLLKSEIEASAARLLGQKTPNPDNAMKEINRICRIMREKKIICEIHKKKDSSICNCGVCYEE